MLSSPSAQDWHAWTFVCPGEGLNLPLGHAVHEVLPAVLYFPDAQLVQDDEAAGL